MPDLKMSNIQDRVAVCFSGVFPGMRRDELTAASTASLARWDSVAHVTLLSALAEEFRLEFEMEDFEELVSYALIVQYLEKKLPDA
jgi:acyl carrier protein